MNESMAVTKQADEKFCSECGSVIKAKAEICPKCGVRQLPATAALAANGKTKVAAALFAILLGWAGGHKFYLRQSGMGILYLVFFWTSIPFWVSLAEFILLITMTDATFNERYGRL